MSPFTIHLRLTKNCNADCIYCSSWVDEDAGRMQLEDVMKSLEFLVSFIQPITNIDFKHVTIQYVGGEILTYPPQELFEIVTNVRNFFNKRNISFHDGVQTNLLGPPDRIDNILNLFGSSISTSFDSFSKKRTFRGCSDKYRQMTSTGIKRIEGNLGHSVSGVFTLDDRSSSKNAVNEYKIANDNRAGFTIRPVFIGGKDIELLSMSDLTDVMNRVFDSWFLKGVIKVEPFYSMLVRTLNPDNKTCKGCHFQSDCASRSLNIDPNGDLYVCYDMADGGHCLLGNAIEEHFDIAVWSSLNSRQTALPEDCKVCPYLSACQGGCMSEAYDSTGDIYGLTPYCSTWKSIFSKMHSEIDLHGKDVVSTWVSSL